MGILRRTSYVLAALALSSGCAVVGHFQRGARLRAELDAHVFAKPLDAVWPEVQRLLVDAGYDLVGKDRAAVGAPPLNALQGMLSKGHETRERGNGRRELETDQDARMKRYRAEGTAVDAEHCRVVLYAVQGSDQSPEQDETRATALELALVERVEPEAAERIASVVDGRGK
jgi:hypothetical protein